MQIVFLVRLLSSMASIMRNKNASNLTQVQGCLPLQIVMTTILILILLEIITYNLHRSYQNYFHRHLPFRVSALWWSIYHVVPLPVTLGQSYLKNQWCHYGAAQDGFQGYRRSDPNHCMSQGIIAHQCLMNLLSTITKDTVIFKIRKEPVGNPLADININPFDLVVSWAAPLRH